jgi:hypothetical protein
MDNTTTMATPHLLTKLDKQNMAKTSFKLPASDSCGDVCAADCPVNGQNASGDCMPISKYSQRRLKIFDIFKLDWVSSKSVQIV